jgi:peptidoglycan/LPS O-acetylase OafA/YrhL
MQMDPTGQNDTLNTIIGLMVLFGSVVVMVVLTWWSHRRIERIARTTGKNARELQHELDRPDV